MFNFFKTNDKFWPTLQWRDWAVLGAGLAVFVGLVASTLTKFSIWFDEAFGAYLVRFDVFELTRYTAFDVHPPFYYWLLKIWTELFGNTELGLRSMSVFFGVLTVVLAFLLVLRLFGRKAAYISLIFLVLSPLFLRYGQEARMYTVLTSTVLLATYILVYAQEHAKKRWPWVAYGVLLAVGMLTQYFAALAWLAHWIWRYLTLRSGDQPWRQTCKKFFSKQWVTAHVVALVVFLPWLPWLLRQFADVQGNGFWIPPVTSATVPDFITNTLLFTDFNGTKGWLALAFYVVVAATIYLSVRVYGQLKNETKKYYLLIITMVAAPMVLLVVLSMPPLRPAFVDRYLMATVVFLPLLFGINLALADCKKKWLPIAFGVIIAGMMIAGISQQMQIGNYNKSTKQSNSTRQLLETIRATNPNATILANTPWIFYEAVVYETPNSPVYFAHESTDYKFGSLLMLKENADHKVMDVDAFAAEHDSFWLIDTIKGGDLQPRRDGWRAHESIVINDDISGAALFKAIRFSAE